MENFKYEKLDFNDMFSKRYKEFTPILNEYFSRMKADSNLSEEQIDNKIILLLKNVRKIKFGILPIKYQGCFIPEKHKILLNANMFNYEQDFENVFSILTHELDHACNYDEKGKKFGMYRYDKKGNNIFNPQDILLDEMRTDIGATRRVFNDNYIDDKKMIRKTFAYQNFSAFSTVLQNSLGIDEKEFLQSSEQGRTAFDKQMESKFPDPEDYYKYMERFTLDTSILFNIKMGKDKSKKSFEYNNAFKDLKTLSYIGLNLKMEKDITDNPNINFSEYLKDIKYSMEENNQNFDYTTKEFGITNRINEILELVNKGRFEDIGTMEKVKKTKEDSLNFAEKNILESKIMYLEMLVDNKEQLGQKYNTALNKITTAEKASELVEYSKEELNLEFKDNQENQFKIELYSDIQEKRNFFKNNSYNWDNSEVIENMNCFFNINKEKKINKLYAKIVKIKFPNKLIQLNSPKHDVVQEVNSINESNKFKKDICNSIKNQEEISKLYTDKVSILHNNTYEIEK